MAASMSANPLISVPVTGKDIERLSGETISACYQCEKCTNGCPMTFAMDIVPHRVMHSLQLSLSGEIINSDTIWVCASCEICSTRCPNDIDIAHVMDTLRQLAIKQGIKTSQKQALLFHRAFLSNVKRLGRMHELSMATVFTLKNEGFKGLGRQAGFGLEMMRKGKMKFVPDRLSAGKEVQDIFRKSEGK
jgi:heterodisulfide reductase subunit C2